MHDKHKFSNCKPSIITIYNQEGSVLLKEPSLVTIVKQIDSILAVGEEANTAIERLEDERKKPFFKDGIAVDFDLTDRNVIIGSPLKNGTIADFDLAMKMFKYFIYKVNGHRLFSRPRIAVCTPIDMTPIEHKTMSDVILNAGAKSVFIIEKRFEQVIKDIPHSYKIIIEISFEAD